MVPVNNNGNCCPYCGNYLVPQLAQGGKCPKTYFIRVRQTFTRWCDANLPLSV
jgi:hypothetical protein